MPGASHVGLTAWRPRRLAAAALAAAFVALAGAGPVGAHAYVDTSEPRDGSVLEVPPAQVRITYAEPVEPNVTKLTLLGPDGKPVPGTTQVAEGDLVLVLRLPPLQPGTYAVRTDTLGKDGHPTREEIRFTVGQPAGSSGAARREATPAPRPAPPAPTPARSARSRDGEETGLRTEIFTNMAVMAVSALVVGGAVVAILFAASRKR